jgi:hypothetical protein
MRIEKVDASPIFRTWCIVCGRRLESDKEPIFADLDGEPFKAYYCAACNPEENGHAASCPSRFSGECLCGKFEQEEKKEKNVKTNS